MRDKKMEDCHYFSLHFKGIIGTVCGRLFSTCNDTINVDFNNGFEDFEVCTTEYIDNQDVFLGKKEKFIDLKIGDVIAIRENAVKIIDFDCETITEFNDFCERSEFEDMMWLENH